MAFPQKASYSRAGNPAPARSAAHRHIGPPETTSDLPPREMRVQISGHSSFGPLGAPLTRMSALAGRPLKQTTLVHGGRSDQRLLVLAQSLAGARRTRGGFWRVGCGCNGDCPVSAE